MDFLGLVLGDDLEFMRVEGWEWVGEKGKREGGILGVDGLGEWVVEVFVVRVW